MKLTQDGEYFMRHSVSEFASGMTGRDYSWGGNDPIFGFDCSGLGMEWMKTNGLAAENEDMNAAAMATTFMKRDKEEDYQVGDLVCFASKSSPKSVNHVGIITETPWVAHGTPLMVLEAGGGGSKTSVPDAKEWRAKAAWWPKGEVGDWLIQIANSLLGRARASQQNAYIRVRPLESILNRGKVLVCVVNPFEKVVGK